MLGDRRLWAIALILLACVGLNAGSRQFVMRAPSIADPDASLRAIATQYLGEGDRLEQLQATLKTLPEGKGIIFFGSSADWGSTEIYLLTSYLHWPDPVWFVHTGGPLKAPAPPAPPESAKASSALFFHGIEPFPGLEGSIRKIGPKLAIATRAEVHQ